MNKISLFLIPFFACLQVFGQSVKDTIAVRFANSITSKELSQHLHTIAGDSMAGRETGEPGQKMAAKYLADKFKESGLQPGVKSETGNSYFQKFELVRKEWKEVYMKINGSKKEFLKDFYAYGDIQIPAEVKLKVTFGGYGITSPNYSDLNELDVKDKAVIIFMGDPMKDSVSLVTKNKSMSAWAYDWRKKVANLKEKGAKEVLVIIGNTPGDFDKRLEQVKHIIEKPSLGFPGKKRPESAFFIPVTLAASILNTTVEDLLQKKNSLSQGSTTASLNFKPSKFSIRANVKETIFSTENVLAMVEGSDKKDEIIVITAHYDHIGKEGGKIYYGADDDGSGTVALLEIAEAFSEAKKAGFGPRRSILFMPVTAEEKGLMGSEYYTDHPVYPLDKTVADLNIDMIGRLDDAHKDNPNYVYLIGGNKLSTELHAISENANKTYTNLDLDYRFNAKDDPNRFYYRSDHYNFAKNRIPVIFYFNGVHEDYHQPTDTVDKILFEKVEKISKLIFFTAWELANKDQRIVVDVLEE